MHFLLLVARIFHSRITIIFVFAWTGKFYQESFYAPQLTRNIRTLRTSFDGACERATTDGTNRKNPNSMVVNSYYVNLRCRFKYNVSDGPNCFFSCQCNHKDACLITSVACYYRKHISGLPSCVHNPDNASQASKFQPHDIRGLLFS